MNTPAPLPVRRPPRNWRNLFPVRNGPSLALVAFISMLAGVLDVVFGVMVFKDYGWTLFVATPCVLGIAAPLMHGIGAPRTFLQLFAAAMLAQVAVFCGMVIFAIEGIICIVMAAPLWLSIAAIGCCIAYPIHLAMWRGQFTGRGFPIVGLFLLPGNRTRLVGTSWYRNELFPAAYWRLWSDGIIHEIHLTVFAGIKQRAEQRAQMDESIARLLKLPPASPRSAPSAPLSTPDTALPPR